MNKSNQQVFNEYRYSSEVVVVRLGLYEVLQYRTFFIYNTTVSLLLLISTSICLPEKQEITLLVLQSALQLLLQVKPRNPNQK